jgi:hypothetical protein
MEDDEAGSVTDEHQTPFDKESFFATVRGRADVQAKREIPWLKVSVLAALAVLLVSTLAVIEVRSRALPSPEPSGIAYCTDSEQKLRNPVELAIEQMQQTSEGRRLFDQLIANKACNGFADLPYNAGYTRSSGFLGSDIQIVLDETVVLNLYADELAAILVHEATHADRAYHGISCSQTLACEALPNGVYLDEEVAAHLAEAKFWITIHGKTGTRGGSSWSGTFDSLYLNELVIVAQEGPEEFRSYVAELRSSPLEGKGINN